MPSRIAKPPPLPQGLTDRMYKTIDRKTGCCVVHPKVRICLYSEDKERWVFKRKTCFQCGARSGVGGLYHKHGRSVQDPSRTTVDFDSSDRSGRSGRSGKSSIGSGSNSCGSSVVPVSAD